MAFSDQAMRRSLAVEPTGAAHRDPNVEICIRWSRVIARTKSHWCRFGHSSLALRTTNARFL
jgi:hypothetical protein